MEGYTERELMEGVYVYEKDKVDTEDNHVVKEPLEERMKQVQSIANSVSHLIRSNEELRAACEEEFDQVFADAIRDNEVTIAKQKSEILELKQSVFEDFQVTIPVPSFVEDCSEGVFL